MFRQSGNSWLLGAGERNRGSLAERLVAQRHIAGCPAEGTDRFDYERFVAVARAGLDEGAFAAAWAEGHTMTTEQAIAYALEKA